MTHTHSATCSGCPECSERHAAMLVATYKMRACSAHVPDDARAVVAKLRRRPILSEQLRSFAARQLNRMSRKG